MYRILRDNRETGDQIPHSARPHPHRRSGACDEIRHRDNYVYRSLFSTDTASIDGVRQPYPDTEIRRAGRGRLSPR